MPQGEHHLGDTIYQMVVPQKSHKTVLLIAPDSGHLGVRKTYDCVLRHFRPHLKKTKHFLPCVQMKGDWEGGVPWLLLAAREVVQESTGFSPNELVFGPTV